MRAAFWCAGLVFLIFASSTRDAHAQTTFTFPLERQSNPSGDPKVHSPWTLAYLARGDDPYDDITTQDPESNDTDESIAYNASGSNLNNYASIASGSTTGEATCLTAVNATDVAAEVDTLVTAVGEVAETDPAYGYTYWANAATVTTYFKVLPHTSYPTVVDGLLESHIWIFAAASDESEGSSLATCNLIAYSSASYIQANYSGEYGTTWTVSGEIQDADGTPLYISYNSSGPELDEYFVGTEQTTVNSTHLVQAIINGNYGLANQAYGYSYGDYDWSLKSYAWFKVTGEIP